MRKRMVVLWLATPLAGAGGWGRKDGVIAFSNAQFLPLKISW